MLTYNPDYKLFIWNGPYESRHLPKDAGFEWSPSGKKWFTGTPYIAYKLRKHAVNGAAAALEPLRFNIEAGARETPVLPVDDRLYPFQNAGVETIVERMRRGRVQQLLADDMGLGKTPQSLCISNEMGFKKLLVICPASVRIKWCREINKWHKHNPGVQAYTSGKQDLSVDESIVTSYALANDLVNYKPDFIIIDEAHYCKNPEAQRTQLILGDYREQWRGLIADTPTLFLSGTPEPNGRPSELYPIIRRSAPDIINSMNFWPFVQRFCNYIEDDYGSTIIKGARNREELYIRLRGSGFMTRRLKKDVLKDLPPKVYNLVVFPMTSDTAKIIKKEEAFDAREIKRHGGPAPDSGLAEIRHEMGLAIVKQALDYVRDILSSVDKVVLFCHHRDVMAKLLDKLKEYNPVHIIGGMGVKNRQKAMDLFQTDPQVRVFVGNEAAEEGIDLFAAQDVILVEPEWLPGKNDQRADRLHRIGQTGSVNVHILVVENSLGLKILGDAADKADDIKFTLDEHS